MATARLVAYAVSVLACSAVIGRLLSIRMRLARVLALVMGAWLLNSIILASYVLWTMATGENVSPWREWSITVVAISMAACPTLLYWYLERG